MRSPSLFAVVGSFPITPPKLCHPERCAQRESKDLRCLCGCLCCCLCCCLCLCCCCCCCCCSFHVVILSAAKNPRISEGSVATRVPFFFHHPNTVISTGAAHSLIVSQRRNPLLYPSRLPTQTAVFAFARYSRHPIFLVKPPNAITLAQSTRSAWHSSFPQSAIIVFRYQKKAPAKAGAFPLTPINLLEIRFYP